MQSVLIVGSGGLAREFSYYFSNQVSIVGYSTINHKEFFDHQLAGRIFGDDVSPSLVGTDAAVIAVGSPSLKSSLVDSLIRAGFRFPSFVHSTAVVASSAKIGAGVVISPMCVVSPNVSIGDFSYLNYSCGIGHDTIVGKLVQVNPGVQIGGSSLLGDGCLLGSGSVVVDNITVGVNSKIASGAVVLAPVSANSSMLGNPARRMLAFE